MLDGWHDCALRTICEQYPKLVEEQTGVALRKKKQHIGTAIGQSLHTAVRDALVTKSLDGAIDRAKAKLLEETKDEFIQDDITKDVAMAETQMARMLAAWYPLSLTYDIAFTELNIGKPEKPGDPDNRVDLGGGFVGSGHIDVVTLTPHTIDHKFGKNKPNSIIQQGFYSLLLRNKFGQVVKGLEEHWIPRRTLNKPQPEPVVTVYDVAIAENLAWEVKEDIKRVVTKFADDGNPRAVPANPKSMLCSEKYCSAWGTPVCSVWKA